MFIHRFLLLAVIGLLAIFIVAGVVIAFNELPEQRYEKQKISACHSIGGHWWNERGRCVFYIEEK